jgi:pyruvate/oxaloacetate carboxyltransferase
MELEYDLQVQGEEEKCGSVNVINISRTVSTIYWVTKLHKRQTVSVNLYQIQPIHTFSYWRKSAIDYPDFNCKCLCAFFVMLASK